MVQISKCSKYRPEDPFGRSDNSLTESSKGVDKCSIISKKITHAKFFLMLPIFTSF